MKRILVVLLISTSFWGCKKAKQKTTSYQVHCVGITYSDSGTNAFYWFNDKEIQLSNNNSWATCVLVDNAETYIGGQEFNNGIFKAVYWQNGIIQYLSGDKEGICSKIFKENNNIYFVGSMDSSIVVWNNGNVIKNFRIGKDSINIMDMKFSGNHLYCCGIQTLNGKSISKLWKDGVSIPIEAVDADGYIAYRLNVVNNDVYIAGFNDVSNEIVMWKNGIKSTIAIVGTFFNLIDITNEHNDIYIAATQFNNDKTQLKVWKNGIEQNLAVNTSVFGRTFKVSNGDFYWGGVQDGMLINNTNAIYLKNESFFSLNNRLRSQVNDIFVERIEK